MQIRTIKQSEHTLIRELRLAALQDAPDSFAESAQDVSLLPESYWIELARSLTSKHVMFIAELDGNECGSVYGIRDENDPYGARVGGMWVATTCRRRGVGTALLAAVIEWSKTEGLSTVRLWVPASGNHAQSLYSNNGFALTGETKSACHDGPFEIREMMLDLAS